MAEILNNKVAKGMCSNYEADITHPESRAGLATVQGWNRVRAADLFEPTPPLNLAMPSWPGDREQTTTILLAFTNN